MLPPLNPTAGKALVPSAPAADLFRRYIELVIRHRVAVVMFTLLVTALAVFQAKHLRIVIDPNTMLPQSHPYISTGVDVAKVFGSKYIVVVGLTPARGDIHDPRVLAKVRQMTTEFLGVPGVVKNNVLSLYARRVKGIEGQGDGFIVEPLAPAKHRDRKLFRLRGGEQELHMRGRFLKRL